MSSLASIMDTSVSGMFAARLALHTIGHNVANANTPGYSRQEVILAARSAQRLSFGILGRGVEVQSIRRQTDLFLLANHRTQSARLASYSQVDAALQEIETIFGSMENDHLGDAISRFFQTWSDLATPPALASKKQSVLSAAQNMVTDFHAMRSSLDDLDASLRGNIEREVTSLNSLLDQVAHLNQQMLNDNFTGSTANDLRDQRDWVVGEIAKLAKVTVVEREDSTVDVIMAGRTLVTRDHATHLAPRWSDSGSELKVSVVTEETKRPVELAEGSLQGQIESREVHLTQVRDQLDGLARLIAGRVNELHVQGHSGPSNGLAFFTGDSAGTLAINPALVEDFNLIAASRSGEAGDNDLALEIAALTDSPLDGDSGMTLMDHYRALTVDLAFKRSSYEFLVENQDSVVAAVEGRLASVRGVSLDQEGANLIMFQNAYDASARVISTVQEMFDTLLDMI